MKTYLLNAVKRLKNYSQKLDANAVLYDKSWEVFNESGDKELMIFRTNKELLISRNGIVQKGTWELLDIANMIIDVGEKTYLFNTAYVEDEFLALKLDGTNEYMIMIETDMKNRFSLDSVKSIEGYLDTRYKSIEQKRIDKEEAEKKKLEEIKKRQLEVERLEKIEREKQVELEIFRIEDIKANAKKRYKNAYVARIVVFSLLIIPILYLIVYLTSIAFKFNLLVFNTIELEPILFLVSLTALFPLLPLTSYITDRYTQAKINYKEYLEIIEKEKINQENS